MKNIYLLLGLLALVGLSSCGGNNSQTPVTPTLTRISVTPGSATMWVGLSSQQLTATGTFSDGSTQDLTATATWSSSASAVASVSHSGVAAPVAAGSANITATQAGVTGSSALTVVGLAGVTISPSGPAISLTGTTTGVQLAAMGHWTDGKTQDVSSGMTWSSSDLTVASVSNTGYVAQAGRAGFVTISAASTAFSTTTAVSVTANTMSNASLNGSYVYQLSGIDASGPSYYLGTMNADGNGAITGQEVSTSSDGIIAMPSPLTATYSVFPDGRGDIALSPPAPLPTTKLRFALSSDGSGGRMMLFDPASTTAMTGVLQKQAAQPFSVASLQGIYVFKFAGMDASMKPQTFVGMFIMDGQGSIISGVADMNDNGVVNGGGGRSSPLSMTGSYTVSADGHGSLTLNVGLTPMHFSMMVVSNSLFRLLCTDSGQKLMGQVELQQAPVGGFQSYAGAFTFLMDEGGRAGVFGMGGKIQFGPGGGSGGWGSVSSFPVQFEITQISGNLGLGGRGSLDLQLFVRPYVTYANYSFATYMVSPTRMYWIETDTQPTALSGIAMGDGAGKLDGTYMYLAGSMAAASGTESSVLALMQATPGTANDGTLNGIVDVNLSTYTPGVKLYGSAVASGNYAADPNSYYWRYTTALAGPGTNPQSMDFYVNSNFQALMFGQLTSADNPMLDGWLTKQ